MSDTTQLSGATPEDDEQQAQHPKHRRDAPVDGDLDLSEFGENPDTEVAG